MTHVEFAAYMRRLRIGAGLTQAEVAKKLKYKNSQYVSNWERGLCLPAASSLGKLAKMYGVSVHEVFDNYMMDYRAELWQKASGQGKYK